MKTIFMKTSGVYSTKRFTYENVEIVFKFGIRMIILMRGIVKRSPIRTINFLGTSGEVIMRTIETTVRTRAHHMRTIYVTATQRRTTWMKARGSRVSMRTIYVTATQRRTTWMRARRSRVSMRTIYVIATKRKTTWMRARRVSMRTRCSLTTTQITTPRRGICVRTTFVRTVSKTIFMAATSVRTLFRIPAYLMRVI
jgi:hypothetical protein